MLVSRAGFNISGNKLIICIFIPIIFTFFKIIASECLQLYKLHFIIIMITKLGVIMGRFADSNPGQLPAGRQAFVELNQEMLGLDTARHSADDGSAVSLEIDVDPAQAERELRASPFGKVMLRKGVLPNAVELTASSRAWRSTPPFKASGPLVDYVQRGIGVGLWYGERTDGQKGDVVQYIGAGYQFDTYSGQVDSAISRRVVAARRSAADRFYHGHNEKQRSANDKRLLLATQTVRELFKLRPVDEAG
jgi:hypothetical protein